MDRITENLIIWGSFFIISLFSCLFVIAMICFILFVKNLVLKIQGKTGKEDDKIDIDLDKDRFF